MKLIDVNCLYCDKLLCRMTQESFVQVKCRHCKRMNSVSVAIILHHPKPVSAKLRLLPRAPAQ
jgi:phage FluMu protein Com